MVGTKSRLKVVEHIPTEDELAAIQLVEEAKAELERYYPTYFQFGDLWNVKKKYQELRAKVSDATDLLVEVRREVGWPIGWEVDDGTKP